MIINEIFTKNQAIVNYSVKELLMMWGEGKLLVRNKNQLQIRKIRNYIFENVVAEQIYLPPLVASIEEGSLAEGKPERLTIIDGTQRILALAQINSLLVSRIHSDIDEERKQGKKLLHSLNDTELAVQIFEGLSTNETDQLYIDLNTKSKKVSLSKRIAYDSRNEINRITNEIQTGNGLLRKAGVELEKRAVMRPNNKNFISLSQLRQIVGLFAIGKTVSSNLAQDKIFPMASEETIELINNWFGELFDLHAVETIGDYEVCMLASFPLLYSIGIYATNGLSELTLEEKKEELVNRMRRLRAVDWHPANPVWREFKGSERGRKRHYYLDSDKRNTQAMVNWLQLQGGE